MCVQCGNLFFLVIFIVLLHNVIVQADTWGSTRGAMFESVVKTSIEIIESCWTKERAPVDTYIMGLATSIRERNDYEEQVALISSDSAILFAIFLIE